MIDVCALIKTNLDAYWTTGIPRVVRDEVNVMVPYPQIVLIDDKINQTNIFDSVKRIDHNVKISVYVKPVTFTEAAVNSGSANLLSYKNTIDSRLLGVRKTLITGSGSLVSLGTWDDKGTINRGTNMKIDNQTFVSEQIITVRYYQGA